MHTRNLLALLAGAVMLAACGGGDDDSVADSGMAGSGGTGAPGAPAPSAVPDSAFGSVAAFVAFLRQLGNDETSEPLVLPAGPAPTSETSEPLA